MVNPILVASFVTVVPAMVAVWYFLHRYEGLFQDHKVFFGLVAGFFAGLVAAALEFSAFRFADADFVALVGAGPAFLYFTVGYAFFEAGIKILVLGMGRFRNRADTPFYGTAFGLGMGAMIAMMVLALAMRASQEIGRPYTMGSFLVLVLLLMGGVFAHGATGAWAGRGSAEGKLWKGWGMATTLQMPILMAYWLYWPNLGIGDLPWYSAAFPAGFAILYGSLLLIITQTRVLDTIVPKEIRDQVRRDLRRATRRAALGKEDGKPAAPSHGKALAAATAAALANQREEPVEPDEDVLPDTPPQPLESDDTITDLPDKPPHLENASDPDGDSLPDTPPQPIGPDDDTPLPDRPPVADDSEE